MSRTFNRRTVFATLAVFPLAVAVLAGCDTQPQQIRDLEGVPVQEPDRSELYANVDQYPNVVALCINGAGFASTTRDHVPLVPVPEWNASNGGWCAE